MAKQERNAAREREESQDPFDPPGGEKASPSRKGRRSRWLANGGGLFALAFILFVLSLAWTTLSIVDLFGAGLVGLTVALGADLFWGASAYGEHRRVPLFGRMRATVVAGWLGLAAVVALLFVHGILLHRGHEFFGNEVSPSQGLAIAIAGPLLPISAKVILALAISARRGDKALTITQEQQLIDARRAAHFDQEKDRVREAIDDANHQAEMREAAKRREAAREQAALDLEAIRSTFEAQMEQNTLNRQIAMEEHEAALEADRLKAQRDMEQLRAQVTREREELQQRAELAMDKQRVFSDIEMARLDFIQKARAAAPIALSSGEAAPVEGGAPASVATAPVPAPQAPLPEPRNTSFSGVDLGGTWDSDPFQSPVASPASSRRPSMVSVAIDEGAAKGAAESVAKSATEGAAKSATVTNLEDRRLNDRQREVLELWFEAKKVDSKLSLRGFALAHPDVTDASYLSKALKRMSPTEEAELTGTG